MTSASQPGVAIGQPSGEVFVLLSSFNGSQFVGEQIESIRRQTFTQWTLLVRDDGSSDDTLDIVECIARGDPRIHLVRDGRGNLGAASSFGALLDHAADLGARYIALADQDDVWQPTKLTRQLELLRRREAETGTATPLLIHSDLTVVAEDLRVVHPSFLRFQHLRHVADWPLGAMLVQNFVTGCTAMFNRALLRAAVPVPNVVMHDWWLALCAAALGEILYLPEATVLYRQHDRNLIGSRGWLQVCRSSLRRPAVWWRESGARFSAAVHQACELSRRIEGSGADAYPRTPGQVALRQFSDAFANDRGFLRRLGAVRRHRIRPRTLLPYPVFFYIRALLWSPLGATAPMPATTSHRRRERDPRRARGPAISNPKDGRV